MRNSEADLRDWLIKHKRQGVLFVWKRLSDNDTLLSGSHQSGTYLPKELLFQVFPSLGQSTELNPRTQFTLSIDSHSVTQEVQAIWYNSKLDSNFVGTRNEARITNLGGENSPLLNPKNANVPAVFAFEISTNQQSKICHVWVCRQKAEEILIERTFGKIIPGDLKWNWSMDCKDLGN